MKKITMADVIIETMPFSNELIEWCNSYPEFLAALKNIYAERFISLSAIVTSYSPFATQDEIIGVYTYDYKQKTPTFKQDFIINKEKKNQEFILYTRNAKGGNSKYVKDINSFFDTYGKGKFYINSHHLTLAELPSEIRERGKAAITLAEKAKLSDLTNIPQEHIDRIYYQVKEAKKVEWIEKRKLTGN